MGEPRTEQSLRITRSIGGMLCADASVPDWNDGFPFKLMYSRWLCWPQFSGCGETYQCQGEISQLARLCYCLKHFSAKRLLVHINCCGVELEEISLTSPNSLKQIIGMFHAVYEALSRKPSCLCTKQKKCRFHEKNWNVFKSSVFLTISNCSNF